jgi:hypothetical protein
MDDFVPCFFQSSFLTLINTIAPHMILYSHMWYRFLGVTHKVELNVDSGLKEITV